MTKKYLLLGLAFSLLVGLGASILLLTRQQDTRTQAQKSTTLSFSPNTTQSAPMRKNVGDDVSFELRVTPNQNFVTLIHLEILYDPAKLQPGTTPFVRNAEAFPSVLDAVVVSPGKIETTISVGSDPTQAIREPTTVGTITMKAIGSTAVNTVNGVTEITYGPATEVLSAGPLDEASENVLDQTIPAYVAIASLGVSPTIPPNICMTVRPIDSYKAVLDGAKEVPSTTSSARGTFVITLEPENANNSLSILETIGLNLQQVQAIHIHSPALPGQEAPAKVTLFDSPGNFTNPYTRSQIVVPPDVAQDIRDGKAYINIHTSQYPDGEIRGQLFCETTPTGTIAPTARPTTQPTATIVPTQRPSEVQLNFSLFLHGIGNSGDNANPTAHSLSNKNPQRPQRDAVVELTNSKNVTIATGSGKITYNQANGNFTGSLTFNTTTVSIPQDDYIIKIKTPRSLKKYFPGIFSLTPNNAYTLPPMHLVAGDADNNNTLNILDYNQLRDCYSDANPPIACNTEKKLKTDFNDDGKVNQYDYNLLLREISVQYGD